MCPVGIGETLRCAISNLIIRGLEASIEEATYTVVQWRQERIVPATAERDDVESEEGRAEGGANNARRAYETEAGRSVEVQVMP